MPGEKFYRVKVLERTYRESKLYEPGDVFVASESDMEKFKQNTKAGGGQKLAPHETGHRLLFEVLDEVSAE